MEIGGSFAFWAVLLGAAVLLLVTVSVRRAGPGELVVVLREGRVVRSRTGGWAVRVPGAERFEAVTTGAQVVPLVARATTRDGTDVVVLADLSIEVDGVAPATPYDDPSLRAARVAEDALAEAVSRLDVPGLGGLVASEGEEPAPVRRVLAGLRGPLGPATRVTGLTITQVEARLTAPVAAALRGRGEAM